MVAYGSVCTAVGVTLPFVLVVGSPESILHFPESDTLPFERLVTDPETEQERIRVLGRLASKSPECARETGSSLIITSISGITQETIGREVFDNNCHTIVSGEQIELEDTLDLWRRMGYKFEPTVEVPGTVSRRGGIIDIYPIGTQAPKRIELWGDEIDSIRLFDPETQRSTETVNSFEVIPAQETLPGLIHHDHIDKYNSAVLYYRYSILFIQFTLFGPSRRSGVPGCR